MTDDDRAFLRRHARDYWLTEVENNDRMAQAYALWFELTFGNGTMKDCPAHSWAIREFRSEIPLA